MSPVSPRWAISVGERFTALEVAELLDYGREGKNGNRRLRYMAVCKCDCGTTCEVPCADLANGRRVSCGCRKGGFGRNHRAAAKQGQAPRFATAKNEAPRRGLRFDLRREQWEAIVAEPCVYCGDSASGIDRLDNGKGYEIGNVVSACPTCNVAKGVLDADEFVGHVKQMYQHLAKSGFAVEPADPLIQQGVIFDEEAAA